MLSRLPLVALHSAGKRQLKGQMPIRGSARFLLVFLGVMVLAWGIAFCQEVRAQSNLRHGVGYYVGPNGAGPEVTAIVAERYESGVTGIRNSTDAPIIKDLNPDFQWIVYNSVTDNYVSPPFDTAEHESLAVVAAEHGWDLDEAYLHFYDDTSIRLQGEDIFVPGWGGGSATSKSEARVPVYYANLSRRAVNFSTPEARQLNMEVILALGVDRTFEGTDLYPDGIMFDNCAYKLGHTGQILDGGHVLETPGRFKIGSAEFQNWHWHCNLGPFLTAVKDTLETSAEWSMDGKRKRLGINMSNSWTDSYVSMDVADVLIMEWCFDPVRNFGRETIGLTRQRDRLAADAGIRTWNFPLMQREVPGQPGEISYGKALLGSLAWHLTTRTDESLLYLLGGAGGGPGMAGWDTLTWRGCVDVVKDQLGNAVGEPYAFAEGTDPTGKDYRVWARHYDNGLVLVRNRGSWSEGIEPETAVSISLPSPLAPISPEGKIGEAFSSVWLRNGTAAILLGDPGPPPRASQGLPR